MKNTILILYSGVNPQYAPRIESLQRFLTEAGHKHLIGGIVKTYPLERATPYLFELSKSRYRVLRALHALACCLRLGARVFSARTRIKLIYAINPLTGMVALTLKLFAGIPFVYESQEIFLGVNHNFFNRRTRWFWYRIEKLLGKHSTFFVTTDQFRAKLLRRIYRIPPEKMEFIFNAPRRTSLVQADTRRDLKIPSKALVVTYCGAIMAGRSIDEIIRAFSLFNRPDARLYLVGYVDETYAPTFRNTLRTVNDNRIITVGGVSNIDLNSYLCASNATFALYSRDSLNNRLNSPNKLFDAINHRTSLITTSTMLSRWLAQTYPIHLVKSNTTEEILSSLYEVTRTPPQTTDLPTLNLTQESLMPPFIRKIVRAP